MQTTIIFLQQKISRSKIHVRLLYHDNRPYIVNHGSEVHASWTTLTFSFLITNDAAPLLSSLGSLSPPRRLRLVVPWFSCWVMSDGEDGSAELQLQRTREVSACSSKFLLIACTAYIISITASSSSLTTTQQQKQQGTAGDILIAITKSIWKFGQVCTLIFVVSGG